jgi:hypothetical protein
MAKRTQKEFCKNEAHVVPEPAEWDGPQWLPVGWWVRKGNDKVWNGKNDHNKFSLSLAFMEYYSA